MCITLNDLFPNPKTRESNYYIFVEEVDKETGNIVGHARSPILIRNWCVAGKYRVRYKLNSFISEKFDSYDMADRHISTVLTKL